MRRKALSPHYRKSRDLIDYDYLAKLSEDELDYLETFTASYYNGSPSLAPGSVPPTESYQLNARRRRDIFGALERVDGSLDQVEDFPPYKSPMADSRKRRRKGRAA